MQTSIKLLFLAAGITAPLTAMAAITVTQSTATNASQTYFTASATDLVNQGQSTFDSQWVDGYTPYAGSNTAALNNGVVGVVDTTTDCALDLDGTWTSIFHLNTATNSAGYQISQIVTLAAWADQRINQVYNVSYSTVTSNSDNDNSTGFTLLTLTPQEYQPSGGIGGASRITLDITGLAGVNAIRFDIAPPLEYLWQHLPGDRHFRQRRPGA